MLKGLIAGDDESWLVFLQETGSIIKGICRNAGLNGDEFEDVAQLFVLKLLDRNCRILRGIKVTTENSFYGWVKVVVSRLVLDYIRKDDVRRNHEKRWGEAHWREKYSINIATGIEMKIDLDNLADILTPAERTLFWLDYRGLKDREIGCIFGIQIKAVQQRLSRLRKKIRDILTSDDRS